MKVMQSWDDGVAEDVRLTEILRRHGAKAAFNLNPARYGEQRATTWQYRGHAVWKLSRSELLSVYEGFEIASHSMSHPDLRKCDPTTLRHELDDCRKILQDWFRQSVTGFAYPNGAFDESVKQALRAAGHTYARTTLNADRVYPPADAMELPTQCHFLSPRFAELYERVKQENGVFFFWGHAYELTDDAMWEAFEGKIKRISSDSSAQWVNVCDLFPAT